MASKKKTTSKKAPAKKAPAKTKRTEAVAKTSARTKKRAKKTPPTRSKTEKPARGKNAAKELTERTITATVTLAGSPEELKSCVEEIIEAAKKVVEKELRKQLKQA
jgi:hypothetical protein